MFRLLIKEEAIVLADFFKKPWQQIKARFRRIVWEAIVNKQRFFTKQQSMSKHQNKLIKIWEDHSLGYELNLTGEMSIN